MKEGYNDMLKEEKQQKTKIIYLKEGRSIMSFCKDQSKSNIKSPKFRAGLLALVMVLAVAFIAFSHQRAMAGASDPITAKVNNKAEIGGASLADVISKSNVILSNITSIEITGGEVTTDDWKYIQHYNDGHFAALKSFNVNDTVTTVADIPDSFENASVFPASLQTVNIAKTVKIGRQAFCGCTSLTTATFPAATSVGSDAFHKCTNLTTPILPAVKTIGGGAFFGCTSLTTAVFPAVTTIEQYAFLNCSNLATLKLPATTATSASLNSFDGCPTTKSLGFVDASGADLTGDDVIAAQKVYTEVNDGNTIDNFWYSWTAMPLTPISSVSITGTAQVGKTLSASVEPNGATAFYVWQADNVNIDGARGSTYIPTETDAGKSITVVASGRGCYIDSKESAAIRVVASDVITAKINGTEIGGASLAAVIGSTELNTIKSIEITGGKVTTDDWKWIHNKKASLTALADFKVADTVTTVADIPSTGSLTADFPVSLKTVYIAKTANIGKYAFYECTNLTIANFPTVTSIEQEAFYGCTSLTTATFPAATMMAIYAFNGCANLTTATFPVATTVGYGAFYGCNKLTTVTFPVATTIGGSAFQQCTNLTTAVFPAATTIKEHAFWGCVSLTTLKLPAKPPTSVDCNTFTNCPVTKNLEFIDSNGNDLTGDALTAAQKAYTAVYDENITDNLWFGWTIVPLTPLSSVSITGTVQVGQTLTANVVPNGATVTYQWQVGNVNINGATKSTYTPTTDDIGKIITVTATGTGSYTGTVTSSATSAVIEASTTKTSLESVTISGTAQVGKTLTAVVAPSDATVNYEWKTGIDIVGTNVTYIVKTDDIGKSITVSAIGIDSYEGTVTSAATSEVIAASTTKTAIEFVTISGTAQVGQTLTAVVDPSDATVNYEWKVGTHIVGTNAVNYNVQSADIGKTITVTATGTGSYTGTATSDATSTVIEKEREKEREKEHEHDIVITPDPASFIKGDVIDKKTGQSVKGIKAQVITEANGNKTVEVKSKEVILIKQPDGTEAPLSNISKVSFEVKNNTNVSISSDGTIKIKDLAKGIESKISVTYDLGNGQKINISTIDVKINSNGDVTLTSTLIDPYGIITDATNGKRIVGADVKLYYANTQRNIEAGKTPDTLVALPVIDGFKPNDNKNPQISDENGAYGFMVFPTSDYYVVITKDGYDNLKSSIIPVENDIVNLNLKMNKSSIGTNRISGGDRIDTAIEIAKASYTGKLSNVVLATSENYPDALTGSVLAYKLNAPILLVGSSAAEQEKVLSYMKGNMDSAGTVYILGGTGAISASVEEKITDSGFKNIKRLGGIDRYETSLKVVEELDTKVGTPIVLVSGEDYPDALSISSEAAIMQYPMLLVQKNNINDAIKSKIAELKPIKVYIIGREGAISTSVEEQALKITGLAKENIVRIGGENRYETSIAVAKYFNLSGKTICVSTGRDFPDALAGSVYAANNNAPIILCDNTLTDSAINYLKARKLSGAVIFGGEAVVSKYLEENLLKLLTK